MADFDKILPRKRVAILQSNYIPWKGYFDLIASADEFVVFDDVQYTRRDWRNRNKLILGGSIHWLTIPVQSKHAFDAPIHAITVTDGAWAGKHLTTLRHAYGKAPHARWVLPVLEELYEQAADMALLTDINQLFLRMICDLLEISTPFSLSTQVPKAATNPTARLVEICLARSASSYLSGPSARAYIDKRQFVEAGLALAYANYTGYPTYPQNSNGFDHGVSMLDILFRFGPEARQHLKSPRDPAAFLDVEPALTA
jgi:WbqC-like protein family